MTSSSSLMKLNRCALSKSLTLLALRVPVCKMSHFMKNHKQYKLKMAHVSSVRKIDAINDAKLILLTPEFTDASALPADLQTSINEHGVDVVTYDLKVGYEEMSYDDVLRMVLPSDVSVPNSFETAGHIAHLNLREQHAPYKSLIGEVLLDKLMHIRTVVTKVGVVSNEFRVFDMEVIAGDTDFLVTLKQHGCSFCFDYSKVYWNSRLEGEHMRMVNTFTHTDVICDMMAGVGPFAVPAAVHKKCTVHANDLNPHSYQYLCDNIKKNRVQELVTAYNMDGRAFVETIARRLPITHVIMNLPASALDFVDVFAEGFVSTRPIVHCYTFCATNTDDHDSVRRRVRQALRIDDADSLDIDLRFVRRVAPNKDMMCVEFRLPPPPPEVQEPPTKKKRVG